MASEGNNTYDSKSNVGKEQLRNWLGVAIILIQLFDIIVHVATDQAEPIRIASNLIMIGWIVTQGKGWLVGKARSISFGAIAAYLMLNLIFLAQNGLTNPEQGGAIRTTLFLLLFLTVGLSTLLAFRLSK